MNMNEKYIYEWKSMHSLVKLAYPHLTRSSLLGRLDLVWKCMFFILTIFQIYKGVKETGPQRLQEKACTVNQKSISWCDVLIYAYNLPQPTPHLSSYAAVICVITQSFFLFILKRVAWQHKRLGGLPFYVTE